MLSFKQSAIMGHVSRLCIYQQLQFWNVTIFSMCICNLNKMLSRKRNNDVLISQICINLLFLEILPPIPYHSLQEKSRNWDFGSQVLMTTSGDQHPKQPLSYRQKMTSATDKYMEGKPLEFKSGFLKGRWVCFS